MSYPQAKPNRRNPVDKWQFSPQVIHRVINRTTRNNRSKNESYPLIHSPYYYDYFHTIYYTDNNEYISLPTRNGVQMTIPRKLAAVIRKHKGVYHPIAKALKVNVYWIHTYITKGKEPNNPETRARMFLPKLTKKHDGRSGFTELSKAVQWWRKLKKDERDQWIGKCYEQWLTY